MARQVQNAVDAGEGDLEARKLRRRLAANAGDLETRIALARLYSRQGLPDLALEHYRMAALQFPDSVVVALSLAKTLREMGGTGEALNAVDSWLAKNPAGNWEMLSLKGILEDEQGRFEAASASFRAALQLEPRRGALHNNLGYNLLLQSKPEEAAAEFRRAIEIDPRSEIAHNNLGAALALKSHPAPAEALSEYRRSADPAAAHNNLAAVLTEQGRYAEARTELLAALAIRRDFPAALTNLRLVAEKDGQPVQVPVAAQNPTLRQRLAKTWNNFVGSGAKATTPAAPPEAGGASADSPVKSAETNDSAASKAEKRGGKTN
jgi:Flp pilus assembly protein TadD